jgi:NADH-quinone oxidoreductase subunit E
MEGHMQIIDVLKKYPASQSSLLEILLEIDRLKENHYISKEEVHIVAEYIGVRTSHVYSVLTFYTLLSTEPRGKHVIQVCKDIPCYVNDAFDVRKTLEKMLNISVGETSRDGLFSLEETACIGCCDEAPAMLVDLEAYTNLTHEKIAQILASYREVKS